MASGRRHLCAVLRKSEMCKCGCRGWCSVFSVFLMIRWAFESMGSGIYPSERHDGQPFGEGDSER
eukprot:5387748-Alexandrium_andersonii.AAC.1